MEKIVLVTLSKKTTLVLRQMQVRFSLVLDLLEIIQMLFLARCILRNKKCPLHATVLKKRKNGNLALLNDYC